LRDDAEVLVPVVDVVVGAVRAWAELRVSVPPWVLPRVVWSRDVTNVSR
jgi:hypothetical protein